MQNQREEGQGRKHAGTCRARFHQLRMFIILSSLVVTLAGGCKSKEEREKARFVGAWSHKDDDGMTTEFTLSGDSTFIWMGYTNSWGILVPKKVAMSGTWKISEDQIIFTISHSSWENERIAGLSESEKITSLEDKEFTTMDQHGEKNLYTRTY